MAVTINKDMSAWTSSI